MKINYPLTLFLLTLSFYLLSAEQAGAARQLFNGKNLDGWVIESNGNFTVEDRLLRVNKGTGWLRSKDQFGDFTLRIEFRFLEPDANSGIFIRTGKASKDDENGWPANGYQIQCRDTLETASPLGAMIPYGAPPFEHLSSLDALKTAYRPTGEWNSFEITCEGECLSVKLNDVLVTLAIHIKNLKGHIGIQAEHGLLEFRKIEVE